jgi:hypothetical protein
MISLSQDMVNLDMDSLDMFNKDILSNMDTGNHKDISNNKFMEDILSNNMDILLKCFINNSNSIDMIEILSYSNEGH